MAITINNPIQLTANSSISTSGNLTLNGAISGAFNLHRSGTGMLTLNGTNSFGSLSFIGEVQIAGQQNLPTGAIAINSGSILNITSSGTITNNLILVGGTPTIKNNGNLTLTGNIDQGSNGTGLAKFGPGNLTLKGTAAHSGPTNVQGGTLAVDGSLSATSLVNIFTGATLSGAGNIFAIGANNILAVLDGGTFAPTGNLTINGQLNLNEGSIFKTVISSNTPGTGYGKTTVSGNVTLSNPLLSITHSYSPDAVHTYTLIDKTSTGSISGTFSGLPQHGTFTAGGNSTILKASYNGGTGNDFTLSTPGNTLPVQFLSFDAKTENSAVRLEWKTASEKNNSHFTIRRSVNGTDFSTIATIPGRGDSQNENSYTAYDRLPFNGISYYQLLQTDLDGKTAELETKSINFALNSKQYLALAPVPAQGFTLASFPIGTSHIELFDISGRSVRKIKINNSSTQHRMNLEDLAKGTYLIKVHGSYGIATAKLIKKD
ncbi:MAG: T9SS type A sorting domain-containing protein [Cytophagaceae bacterium]|nr:MAG: T9SS type A sorting domain-containing protein [Cytophagaceae bacterium]